MNILLINPVIRLCQEANTVPMGLGYIAASLIQEGHTVVVYDINACRWSNDEVKKKIENEIDTYEAVGIGGLITTYSYVKWVISIIKMCRPDIPVIVGDNGASFSYQFYLEKAGADIAVIGEGDVTIKEVIKSIKEKAALDGIHGIAFKKGREICKTSARMRIGDLDNLPYPAWDLFPIEKYITQNVLGRNEGRRVLAVSATRGCPYLCTFCYPAFGRNVRMRSVRSIIDEIKFLKDKYKIEYTGFTDDLFVVDRKRVFEFCESLTKEKVQVKWCAAARVNLVDRELLVTMKKSGCNWVGYGIESANQQILNEMKKGITVDQARRAMRITKETGMTCCTSYVVGMPSETPDSIEDTARFIIEEDLDFGGFFYATPYPGCELYNQAIRSGRIRDEEEFIMKLGDAKAFLVNLTRMPDEELVMLKERAEDRILQKHGKFTGRLIMMVPKPIGIFIRLLWCLRYWGIRCVVRRAIRKIKHD